MNEREAMQLALNVLETTWGHGHENAMRQWEKAIEALKQALAQPPEERNFCPRCGKLAGKNDWDVHTCSLPEPEQEPVRREQKMFMDEQEFYTIPPQRNPLTDEQIKAVIASIDPNESYMPPALKQFARAIEAAHGIKE